MCFYWRSVLLLTTSRRLALQMFSKGTETKKWHDERMLVKDNLVARQEWTRRLTLVRKESYYWCFNLTWVSHDWKSCRDCWLAKPSIKPILILYLLLVRAFCKYFWDQEIGLQLTSCCSFLTPSTSLLQCNTSMASFLWWYHHIGTDHAQWCAIFSCFVLHEVSYPVNLEVQFCCRGCVVSAMFQMAFSKMIWWAPCYPAFLCKRGLKETTRVDGLFCKLNCRLWHCV